jgi:small subunit ribosomal protein S10
MQFKIKSLEKQAIDLFDCFIVKTFKKFKCPLKRIGLPKNRKRVTLIKSPHVDKSAREQFEIIVYSKLFEINSKINRNYINYLILNKPKNIKIILLYKRK